MDREGVRRWVDGYEMAWRTHGIQALEGLFTEDATYQMSPWSDRYVGIAAIAELWEAERDGPDEEFTMTSSVIAVDGSVAVVRAEVLYARGESWRDLWVLRFDEEGRCQAFEEWPFAPKQPDGH